MKTENATFLTFKTSGKYYTIARGHLPKDAFGIFTREERKEAILKANNNLWPGLSSKGIHFHLVVNADNTVDYGYPLMFPAETEEQ